MLNKIQHGHLTKHIRLFIYFSLVVQIQHQLPSTILLNSQMKCEIAVPVSELSLGTSLQLQDHFLMLI